MKINLPCNTPSNIVKRIRAIVQTEKLQNAYFPRTTSVHLSNPRGIVTITGKGSESEAAQMLLYIANNLLLLSQQS